MNDIPHKKYTQDQLTRHLRTILNTLQMRDWEVDLVCGTVTPKRFAECHTNSAAVNYDLDMLRATIWINFDLCKERNQSPLWNLYHEVFHVWLNYIDSEERQCNILSNIMLGERK